MYIVQTIQSGPVKSGQYSFCYSKQNKLLHVKSGHAVQLFATTNVLEPRDGYKTGKQTFLGKSSSMIKHPSSYFTEADDATVLTDCP